MKIGSVIRSINRHFPTATPHKIGIIGLGYVGGAVSDNLLRKGFNLCSVYDVDMSKGKHLPMSVTKASNPRQLTALSDVIITALPHPDVLKEVAEGIIAEMKTGKTWIDHSTTDYEQTLKFAKEVESKGGGLLEVPLTGGIAALRRGSMTAYVGGDKILSQEMTPILNASYKSVVHLGPIGHAQIAKLATNFLCCTHVVAMGEVLMLCKKAGLDLKKVWNAVRVSAGNSFIWETGAPLVFNGTFDPDFSVKLECKDLHLSYLMSKKFQVPMSTLALVSSIYQQCLVKFGEEAGCYIPPKLLQHLCNEKLQEKGFENWTYDFDRFDGSGVVKHEFTTNNNARETN